jgi:acetyl esterase
VPLDPQIAAVLSVIDTSGMAPISATPPAETRENFRLMAVTMRDPKILAPVRSSEDDTIPGPAGPIPIRVYRPAIDAPVPTMVFFHGGGFVLGDLDTHDDQARRLCHDVGVVVVSVDYRLAPEHPFPAAFDDCLAATRWAGARLDSLGGDSRFVVGGDSAGGNLAAAVALAVRSEAPTLTAQFLVYPVVDFTHEAAHESRTEHAQGLLLTGDAMEWFHTCYMPDAADPLDPRLSPLHADLAGAPPAVIGTAEFDPLRDEGNAYAKALADAGVEVRLHQFAGLIHGFYALGPVSAAAAEAVAELNASLRDLLG